MVSSYAVHNCVDTSSCSTGGGSSTTATNKTSSGSGSNSGTNRSSSSAATAEPPLVLIRDALFIFLAGVAIVAGVLIITYLTIVLIDKLRTWMKRRLASSTTDFTDHHNHPRDPEAEANLAAIIGTSRIVYDAGLQGMTIEERRKLLHHIFQPMPYQDDSPTKQLPMVDDPEVGTTVVDRTSLPTKTTSTNIGGKSAAASPTRKVDGSVSSNSRQDSSKRSTFSLSSRRKSTSNCSVFLPDESWTGDDYLHTCSICLVHYEPGATLLHSHHCAHVFHHECCTEWLQQHDVCPYCRSAMFTPEELQTAAWVELGPVRVNELRYHRTEWEKALNLTPTATTAEDSPDPVRNMNESNNDNDHPGIIARLYS